MTDGPPLTLDGLLAGLDAEGRVPFAYAVAGDAWLARAWAGCRRVHELLRLLVLAGHPAPGFQPLLYDRFAHAQRAHARAARADCDRVRARSVRPCMNDLVRRFALGAPTTLPIDGVYSAPGGVVTWRATPRPVRRAAWR